MYVASQLHWVVFFWKLACKLILRVSILFTFCYRGLHLAILSLLADVNIRISFNEYQHRIYIIFAYLSAVMAGMAPEGSQFDARQYDTKMNDMLVFVFSRFHLI